MDTTERQQIEARLAGVLKSIYDPEIPVNIYDLGLIYKLEVDDEHTAHIIMTLTAPNCPMADQLIEEVQSGITNIPGIKKVDLKLTFNPPWDRSMLSDEAKLELGFM